MRLRVCGYLKNALATKHLAIAFRSAGGRPINHDIFSLNFIHITILLLFFVCKQILTEIAVKLNYANMLTSTLQHQFVEAGDLRLAK
jgi:uncharacterized protein YunC (DUF1805 family)